MRFTHLIGRRLPAFLFAGSLLFTSLGATAQTVNRPPVISGAPPTWVYVGSQYSFRPSAYDTEGATLRFTIANKPAWASFSTYSGRLIGTPSAVGLWLDIQIRVSDGTTVVALPAFSIRATSRSNVAPTISGTPSTSATVAAAYNFQPLANDRNGDPLRFAITSRPAWASFDSATGQLSGTPSSSHVGTYSNILIRATDGSMTAYLPAFSIVVRGGTVANRAPVISGSPASSVTAGAAYSFQPSASDADGNALTFSVVNAPVWASFSGSTGRLSGTPTIAQAGTYSNITIRVSDGQASASLPAFSIAVQTAANRAPTISGSPATAVTAGQPYAFQPAASDPDGNALGFTIQNRPSWAAFNTSTGRLSGTPATTNVGSYANVIISVSDGTATTALPAFSIAVNAPANTAPVISGTPPTAVNTGSAYSFRPTASDANGDALTFSIANGPAWTSFSTATGQLTGSPTAVNVGAYSNIVISVGDGRATAALPAFAINVTEVSVGGATLSWTPPTQNTDGSGLTNLSGYRIYYGVSASQLTQTVQIANAGLTTYLIENLAPGTYYFAVRAYTADGNESANSNLATKVVM